MYSAIVGKIRVHKHPNADKLELGIIYGNQVVVAKDSYSDGDLVLFYPTDGQLSDEYCLQNDLYPTFDEKGNRTNAGYIDPKNRRVRSQKFRAEKSDGLVMPLSSVSYTGVNLAELTDGFTFTELNGKPICNKYETPSTIKARLANEKKKVKKIEIPTFKEHVDTEQFRYKADSIKTGSLITITEKIHSTSQRSMCALVTTHKTHFLVKYFPFLERFLSKTTSEWKMVHGTRRTIMSKEKEGFYGRELFRWNVADKIHLRKNEAVYYELCHVNENGQALMPNHQTEKTKDKTFIKKFGKEISYSYGCKSGETRAFVYRITVSNEDGFQWDLPWAQVKRRSSELGLETVPEIKEPFIFNGDVESLRDLVESLSDGESLVDSNIHREGVCIRVENDLGVTFMKNKCFYFRCMEDQIKTDERYIDPEEIS